MGKGVNANQYRWVVASKQCYKVCSLFDVDKMRGMVGRATRVAVRRAVAVEAWQHIAPVELVKLTKVEAFEAGALLITVADSTALHCLRQQTVRLQRRMASVLHGVRRVRFALGRV